jgi:AcrR family transcriptional regulator
MVGISSRKQRERQEREELILEHAQRLLQRDGFQGFNLDELAKAVEYSKGTLYLHFETKEDIALAVSTRAMEKRADLFDRASAFVGTSRERIAALGYAARKFAVQYPDYFRVQMMLKSHSFWEKASTDRRRLHGVQAARAFHHISRVVTDALVAGDLPPGTPAPLVSISLISVTIGSQIAGNETDFQILSGNGDPSALIQLCQDRMCDGWQWRPLSTSKAWDYAAVQRRLRAEIFTED